MTDEIREKAEALIQMLEGQAFTCMLPHKDRGGAMLIADAADTPAAIELKASLRPSREQIADMLQSMLDSGSTYIDYVNYAIEELRK